ncbi:MAG: restriction endonuclease subunit S [Pseudomonadota bacterium]
MSPFDAARYARLLEGLEVSEICWSALENELTLGSEYYGPTFLEPVSRLNKSAFELAPLSKACALITDGDHGSADYASEGVTFVLSEAVTDGWVELSKCRFITHQHAKSLKRSQLRFGDVLVTKTGVYFGKSAVVEKSLEGANTIAHVGILRLRSDVGINPYFLSTFLNSPYGYAQLRRRGIKATRPEIKLLEFDDIRVPLVSKELQLAIEAVVRRAHFERDAAQTIVAQGEAALLHALALDTWRPPEPLTYIRRSSEAFASGRLDAQHFQPRYRALTDFLEATGESSRLGDWLNENQRGKQPDYAEDGIPVVNSKHVLRGEVRLDSDNRNASFTDDDLLIHHGDVLMNGTGVGTIGRVAPYLHADPAIPDNHVTILRPKQGLDPVYLSVFLNSMAGQWQVEERLRGSSGQIELYPTDIAQFTVWIAPPSVQKEIRRSVEKSYEQKQHATQLLNAAKRAVEIAIEDSEAASLEYLGAFK